MKTEETYNIDFFNSHSTSEIKENEKSEGGTCNQTCPHYFTGLQVGELISFILLGCLTVSKWGQITMWCHGKCLEIRGAAKERKRAKTEKKTADLKAQLEMEMKARESESAGGCLQAAKPEAKTDSIQVDLS